MVVFSGLSGYIYILHTVKKKNIAQYKKAIENV